MDFRFIRKFLLLFAIFIIVSTLLYVSCLYFTAWKYLSLVSNIKAGGGVTKVYSSETPSSNPKEYNQDAENLIPIVGEYTMERDAIVAVSTGDFSEIVLKDFYTGKPMANAEVLKVVTKNAQGSIEVLKVVLRLYSLDNPNKDVAPLFAKLAYLIKAGDAALNRDSIQEVSLSDAFPKGTKWLFKPITDLDSYLSEFGERQEYNLYVRKFYGENTSEVRDYINSGLTKNYNKPLLLLGLNIAD